MRENEEVKNIHSLRDNWEQKFSLAKPVINKTGLLQLHTHCWFLQSAPTRSRKCLGLCVGKQEEDLSLGFHLRLIQREKSRGDISSSQAAHGSRGASARTLSSRHICCHQPSCSRAPFVPPASRGRAGGRRETKQKENLSKATSPALQKPPAIMCGMRITNLAQFSSHMLQDLASLQLFYFKHPHDTKEFAIFFPACQNSQSTISVFLFNFLFFPLFFSIFLFNSFLLWTAKIHQAAWGGGRREAAGLAGLQKQAR